MNVIVVGLSHKTATVDIRERVSFSPNDICKPLRALVALEGIVEGVIVSTCNRVEIYTTTLDIAGGIERVRRFFADWHQLPCDLLEPYLYSYHGEDAIRHVFRVASSLDSMIVGEPQILGQIKTSYGYAAELKTSGIILNRLLHKAFSVAKRVRTETAIASSAVSVSFAAVERAKKIFDSLTDKTVLLIGAGEMCELAARHFQANGVNTFIVANRTFERGERLAKKFGGTAIRFDALFDHLHKADIILSSTGAPRFIISPRDLGEVICRRRNKPMFFIDIAVPRDIDPEINNLDAVYLYDMDDLQQVVSANLKNRKLEAEKAELIVTEEIGQFFNWLATLEVTPTIIAMRKQFDELRQAELAHTMSNWKDAPDDTEQRLEALTNSIMNKILHSPTVVLKDAGKHQGNRTELYIDTLRTLFKLTS
jgi:glutamyl-tRNA reductase